jgi:hypothetical protein
MLVKLMSVFGLWVATNVMDVPKEGSLNKMFPDIATTSVEEVVGAWKGKWFVRSETVRCEAKNVRKRRGDGCN